MTRAAIEDLIVGDVCDLGTTSVTEEAIIAFAREFDPQPFHTDVEAAKASETRGLIASGWHTAAIVMRLIAEGRPFGISPILGIGVDELRWPAPTRPGDVCTCSATVLEARASASKPDRGFVRLHVELKNQRGETLLSMKPMMVVPTRAGMSKG